MDLIYRLLCILISVLILVIIVFIWILYHDPNYTVTWWNRSIKSECDNQDKFSLNGIPSYYDAWDCPNKSVKEFHQLITIYHQDILDEVVDLIKSLDDHTYTIKNIYIRFNNQWTEIANKVPNFKRLISLFSDIPTVMIGIFNPGTTLIQSKGKSRSVYKYYYGLKILEGDIGSNISGFNIKWNNKEGFICDETSVYSDWNHTLETNIVIMADIFRELSYINSLGSKIIYSLIQTSK